MAGKVKAIPAEFFLVGKNVEIFREIRAKIPIFPLANTSWILIVKPNPYISMKAWDRPVPQLDAPGGKCRLQLSRLSHNSR
ncbi:MAG: hypothetical protein ABSC88_10290 [Terracidiphilus sp.]|jgi:hypothetical protein